MPGLSEPAGDEQMAFALARRLGLSWREVRDLPPAALPFLLPAAEQPVRLPWRHRALAVFWRARHGRR